ncbi:MAG: AsmA family protein [Acetobacteraceae bacterium]|nr:AsmA family protein [Acetobacteraceae bacterium]
MTRPLRIALIAVAAVLVVAVGAGAIFVAQFDANTLKPRIIEAVRRATGRDLALNGKISLKPSLWPTIHVEDVAFSNPPNFSRPQMATLQALDLQLGLLPLLSSRIEIERLLLIHPDILLETATTGQSNWQMTPEVSPTAPQTSPQAATRTKTSVSVNTINIQDGTIAYRDDATGKLTTISLPKLEAKSASPDSPLHLDADAVYNATAFNLTADTGSLTRLQDPAAASPWPVKLALTVGTAKLAADGSMTQPLRGKGYHLAVTGSVPDASALAPLLGGFVPPPLHDMTFAAMVADTGGKLPEFSTLTLHVGASDLGAQIPGLMLDKLDIDAPKLDQPVKVDAGAKFSEAPLTVTASFGPPLLLMPNAKPAPFLVDVTIQAAGATASAKGMIADAHAMTGANIAVTAKIPDLSALSPLVRHPLPALKSVAFQTTLTDADGGFRNGAALHGISLTGPNGDMSGDATIGFKPRASLTAALKSTRIDLDAIQAAVDQMPAATPSAPDAKSPPPKPPPSPKGRDERLFSDQPIPFDPLRTADADLKLDIADLHSGGADYKAIDTRAVLTAGRLKVDPFAADLPGGHLSGALSVDAAQPVPQVHVVLHAPGLALKTILAATHQPSYASGNLEVYADLTGTGDSPHAIAASLDGSLGLAMAGGTIDNRLLGSLLGKVMDSLNALDLVGKGGTSELKCFGLRMGAKHGIGAIRPLALSSSLLTMTGLGTVNLGEETVAMALRPQARVAGTGLVIPVAVSGPIRNPTVKVNDLGAAEANAGTVAGVILGDATPLGIVGGLLGADKLLGGGNSDICTPALAAARGQAVPEAGAEQPSASKPGAFFKNLFR